MVCDKNVPVKVKGRIHKAIVRLSMLYGIETVPLNKSMMEKMDAAEIRMFRCEIGLTREDKVRNEIVQSKFGVKDLPQRPGRAA